MTTNHNDVDEMTDKEDQLVEDFFNAGDFIEPNTANHSGSNFEYVWEDFAAADAFEKANPNLHAYTVIESEDRYYITKGKHFVNRYGYLFSKDDAGLSSDEELRIR